MCNPAVPLETAAAYGAPTRSARSSSKRSIAGPSESWPERKTFRTSSSSRSSMYGRESGTRVSDAPGRPRSRPAEPGSARPDAAGRRMLRPRRLSVLNCTVLRAEGSPPLPAAPQERRCRSSRLRGRCVPHLRVFEPLRPALALAATGVEVGCLKLLRHRPRWPDHAVVDLADRRHLAGGAGHEDLVRGHEVGAAQVLPLARVPHVLRLLDQHLPAS